MVQSLNTSVDLKIKGISYLGLTNYGQIMVGDKSFEFYSDRNIKDYIQIPWVEIDHVVASVMFKGKWIPRFAIVTKKNGTLSFSSRNNKVLLRAINKYISSDKMVRSLSFFQVLKRGILNIFSLKKRNKKN